MPCLEWIESTAAVPGEDHRIFWGTIQPVDSPFWAQHSPGDRWNCQCSLEQTDKAPTHAVTNNPDGDNPAPGLDGHPAEPQLFAQSHPYYPKSCMACPFVSNKLAALYHNLADNRDCNNCKAVSSAIQNTVNSNDITSKLKTLQTAESGSKYLQTLKEIVNMTPIRENQKIYSWITKNDKEFKSLMSVAEKAVKHGYKTIILPNPDSVRSMDFIFIKKGVIKAFDLKNINGLNSVGTSLRESIGQTRRVLLNINPKYNARKLADEIKNYFQVSKEAQEIMIFKGNTKFSITRDAITPTFYKKFRVLWEQKK